VDIPSMKRVKGPANYYGGIWVKTENGKYFWHRRPLRLQLEGIPEKLFIAPSSNIRMILHGNSLVDQLFATVGFIVKGLAIGAVLCAVFEFRSCGRLFRADVKVSLAAVSGYAHRRPRESTEHTGALDGGIHGFDQPYRRQP